jgi:hypothetical protein
MTSSEWLDSYYSKIYADGYSSIYDENDEDVDDYGTVVSSKYRSNKSSTNKCTKPFGSSSIDYEKEYPSLGGKTADQNNKSTKTSSFVAATIEAPTRTAAQSWASVVHKPSEDEEDDAYYYGRDLWQEYEEEYLVDDEEEEAEEVWFLSLLDF